MRCPLLPNLKFSILLLCAFSVSAMAQGKREGTWDVGVALPYLNSQNFSGQQGSGLGVDAELGFAFWGNYNFTNRLGLGFDIGWVSPSYNYTYVPENTLIPQTIRHRMDMFSIQGKGVFHFVEGPITPYVELGLGWTTVDSNIADGPPTTGCWWDPWWGYVCNNFYSTYGETLTSYSGALGLRWDINPYYGLRAAYGILELNTGSGLENAQLDMWRVEFAWRF